MIREFKAFDYTSNDSFIEANYVFEGSFQDGWIVKRNAEIYLKLGAGYKLLKTSSCGICSTDLARRFLPFPLPQIIGHEVVAEDIETGTKYVIEINDTPLARNEKEIDTFSREGIHTHSPERMVLGIDRLPGGFGPYILAPVNAIVPYGELSEKTAVLIEPFAASLQAVYASPPREKDVVAVLGPRRLGSLILAALNAYRNSSGKDFKIVGLARHDNLLKLALTMGADSIIDLRQTDINEIKRSFSIVYDTTGSEEGFLTALKLAKREVHLKSTNGQSMGGLQKLTELVVDELSLIPFSKSNLSFNWPRMDRINKVIYAAPGVDISEIPPEYEVIQCSFTDAIKVLSSNKFKDRVPRFDLGIAGNLADIDTMIRPDANENSLIRPRGAILLRKTGSSLGNSILEFISSGKSIRSSRCGDFRTAIKLLNENKELAETIKNLISATFKASELAEAFNSAKNSEYIKVVIKH